MEWVGLDVKEITGKGHGPISQIQQDHNSSVNSEIPDIEKHMLSSIDSMSYLFSLTRAQKLVKAKSFNQVSFNLYPLEDEHKWHFNFMARLVGKNAPAAPKKATEMRLQATEPHLPSGQTLCLLKDSLLSTSLALRVREANVP